LFSNFCSTSIDGCVRLWDTRTSQCQAAKWGHTKGVLDFAPSPDYKSLVTASDDHTARVFQMVSSSAVCVNRKLYFIISILRQSPRQSQSQSQGY
jgi:WD40 repeat protein